jgi:excisionase family DNA binding protein
MHAAEKVRYRKSPKTFPTTGAATVADACDFLRCGKSTVYLMVAKGKLRKQELISEIRIPWSSLWEYIGDPVPKKSAG